MLTFTEMFIQSHTTTYVGPSVETLATCSLGGCCLAVLLARYVLLALRYAIEGHVAQLAGLDRLGCAT